MYSIDEREYREFRNWKARQAAEQELQRVKERKANMARELRDDFLRNKAIDAELMRGINDGLHWEEFVRATAAPSDLKGRYEQLQHESGIPAGSVHRETEQDRQFLKGFEMGAL